MRTRMLAIAAALAWGAFCQAASAAPAHSPPAGGRSTSPPSSSATPATQAASATAPTALGCAIVSGGQFNAQTQVTNTSNVAIDAGWVVTASGQNQTQGALWASPASWSAPLTAKLWPGQSVTIGPAPFIAGTCASAIAAPPTFAHAPPPAMTAAPASSSSANPSSPPTQASNPNAPITLSCQIQGFASAQVSTQVTNEGNTVVPAGWVVTATAPPMIGSWSARVTSPLGRGASMTFKGSPFGANWCYAVAASTAQAPAQLTNGSTPANGASPPNAIDWTPSH